LIGYGEPWPFCLNDEAVASLFELALKVLMLVSLVVNHSFIGVYHLWRGMCGYFRESPQAHLTSRDGANA